MGDSMRRSLVAVVVGGLLAMPIGAAGQTFVAPKPEGASPRPQATAPAAQPGRQQRRTPTTPASPCVDMTREWVDYRPLLDFPTLQGRINPGEQVTALTVCQAEQAARPNDLRLAFIYARTLEVNDRGTGSTALYRQLSNAGYAPATTQLARAYHLGNGVAANRTEACDLYVKAARAGDAWAFNPAADCLSFQDFAHDPRLACRFFQQAQASGTFQTTNLTREDYCR